MVAGLGGGTGSGMFLDAAYAARHKLRQLGYADPEVVGLFLLPAAERGAKGPGLANAYTALRELNHFSRPDTTFTAEYEERDGQVSDSAPPFARCYAVPLPPAPRPGVAEPHGTPPGRRPGSWSTNCLPRSGGPWTRPAAGRRASGVRTWPCRCSATPPTSGRGRPCSGARRPLGQCHRPDPVDEQ